MAIYTPGHKVITTVRISCKSWAGDLFILWINPIQLGLDGVMSWMFLPQRNFSCFRIDGLEHLHKRGAGLVHRVIFLIRFQFNILAIGSVA